MNIKKTPRTRLRPIPLNTVEMTKLISKKLRINSHEAMDIAEKLYQKGLGITIDIPNDLFDKIENIEINGYKFVKEKSDE